MPPKKKTIDIEVPAVDEPSAPEAPILHPYVDRGNGYATVQLVGIDGGDQGAYRVGAPIPQDVANGGITYDIHDRSAGIYHQRGR